MPNPDQLSRFLFENADIRGQVVSLNQSYQDALAHQHLPFAVQYLLGEFLAAASLLSATLKFDGILTLQARGKGALPLIMAECSHNKEIRGIAHPDEDLDEAAFAGSFQDLLGDSAVLSITIDPVQGSRYQGIVPLDAPDLAGCLEHYFQQSEQLDTRFWLAAGEEKSGGLLLQALPKQLIADADTNKDSWNTAVALAQTVTTDELLELDHETLLFRLFNEQGIRLFEPQLLHFACSCSRQRCEKTLETLGELELQDILAEDGLITVDCQFCNQRYEFLDADIITLFHPTQH